MRMKTRANHRRTPERSQGGSVPVTRSARLGLRQHTPCCAFLRDPPAALVALTDELARSLLSDEGRNVSRQ